jgi:enoyl-[acyl-carrier-protein] reductase (NADH)
MPKLEEEFKEIRSNGHEFLSFNSDALSLSSIDNIIDSLSRHIKTPASLRLLLHSIACGNLKPIAPSKALTRNTRLLDDEDFSNTIYGMGTSLMTWVQKLHTAKLFAKDARVLGMTSEGNRVAWRNYAAVSAAKAALESLSRSIAYEFGPYGIRSNVIQAGITDTPALRLIPQHIEMKMEAAMRNPLGRRTLPEDVANVISLLCTDEAAWINGSVIRVDGGESISAKKF